MPNFKQRSTQKELMDDSSAYTAEEFDTMYREINFINKYLLGDYFILQCIKKLAHAANKNQLTILDLGCGNGDLLKKIKENLKSIVPNILCVGYDPYLLAIGAESNPEEKIYLYDSWHELTNNHSIDISTTSLTLHHLYGHDLEEALHRLIVTPKFGFVICDLIRTPFAYYAIKVLTALFASSHLVKHDAPLSVLRGFSKKEMRQMETLAASVANITLQSNIAFRWMLTGKK